MDDYYINVLIESATVSGFIPFAHEPTFFAMVGFGGYNLILATAIAVLGAAIGSSFGFIVGVLILKLYRKYGNQKHLTAEQYNMASRIFSRFFILLLPFTWLPMLNFLPLIAGFLGQRARIVLPLVIIGKIAYYSYCIKIGKPII